MHKKNQLQSVIFNNLHANTSINFSAYFVTKGCLVDVEIGDKKNEACGEVYNLLQSWIGYGEFLDYIIDNGGYGNFDGKIVLENNEVIIYLTLYKGDIFEEEGKFYLDIDENVIYNEMNISPESIGMDDDFFESSHISIDFFKEKGNQIKDLKFWYYQDDWKAINLSENQINLLIKNLEKQIEDLLPEFNMDFNCEINWEVSCVENKLEFSLYTSPIRIELKSLIEEEENG
jgi:hypothetical protein